MNKYIFKSIAALLVCFTIAGCNKQTSEIPTIEIQNAKPSGEQTLLAGEEINFNIGILANHAPKSSRVGLVVQSADDTLLGIAAPIQVKNGQEIQLSVKTVIPQTTSVSVYAALYGDTNKDSIAVDSRAYRVIGVKK